MGNRKGAAAAAAEFRMRMLEQRFELVREFLLALASGFEGRSAEEARIGAQARELTQRSSACPLRR